MSEIISWPHAIAVLAESWQNQNPTHSHKEDHDQVLDSIDNESTICGKWALPLWGEDTSAQRLKVSAHTANTVVLGRLGLWEGSALLIAVSWRVVRV